MIQALQLVSISINNVLSSVKIWHGVDPKTVLFIRSAENKDFEAPWQRSVGAFEMAIDVPIDEASICRYSRKELLEVRKKASAWRVS